MLKSAKAVIASQAAQRTMVNQLPEAPLQGDPRRLGTHTTTGLKRWSCQNKDLPCEHVCGSISPIDFRTNFFLLPAAVSDIKAIHVYDFDNTRMCSSHQALSKPRSTANILPVFCSPLPNPQLWAGPTIGSLQGLECFTNGGWWHDARILQATGGGMEVEEPLGWKGWWNEQIVCDHPLYI